MCYYTFDFVFTHQGKFNQKYKVLLIDPRKEEPLIISEGTITDKDDADKNILTNEATIEWSGAYEVDGCGFFVIINQKEYKPVNETIIDDSYKSGQVDVTIKYELLNEKIEKSCGDLPYMLSFDGIRIISIESCNN